MPARAGVNPTPTHILCKTTVIAKQMSVNGERTTVNFFLFELSALSCGSTTI